MKEFERIEDEVLKIFYLANVPWNVLEITIRHLPRKRTTSNILPCIICVVIDLID